MTSTVDTRARIVYDLADAEYHRHPALSYSGAKLLLPPLTPAHYRYDRTHPRPPKRAFDLGHAVHRVVLGAGAELVDITVTYGPKHKRSGEIVDDYRTDAAIEARDDAYDKGQVPLLWHEREQVDAMAAAVMAHPLAGRLYAPGSGTPEVSLFWTDEATGVPMRCRLDWLPHPVDGRPLIVPDLKSRTGSIHADVLGKVVDDYRYFIQDANYRAGIEACGLAPAEGVAFVFVFVEVTPPHLVNVVQLDPEDIALGRGLMHRAAEIYRDCTASGVWPGHPVDIHTVSTPLYARRRHEEALTHDRI